MADTTEPKPEHTAAASEPAAPTDAQPAASIESTETGVPLAGAEPHPAAVAAAAIPEQVLKVTAHEAPPAAAPAANSSSAGATGEAMLNVRPGFDFSKLRPEIGKFRPRLGRFLPSRRSLGVAAALALACGLGLALGSLGQLGIGRLMASAGGGNAAAAAHETAALKNNIAHIEGQVAALKTSVDHANRAATAQSKGLNDRFERSARAQADLQARLTKIGDTVDRLTKNGDTAERLAKISETVERLEKRITTAAANDVTGSVPPQRVAAAPVPPPVSEAPKKPAPPPVLDGWVIRDVFRGRALVASRHGVYEAAPGLELPGLGQVESVKQQDGRWVVVTEKGLIVASRGPRSYYR